jgi:hypothetical protein
MHFRIFLIHGLADEPGFDVPTPSDEVTVVVLLAHSPPPVDLYIEHQQILRGRDFKFQVGKH